MHSLVFFSSFLLELERCSSTAWACAMRSYAKNLCATRTVAGVRKRSWQERAMEAMEGREEVLEEEAAQLL